jgi:hypothetical protein
MKTLQNPRITIFRSVACTKLRCMTLGHTTSTLEEL